MKNPRWSAIALITSFILAASCASKPGPASPPADDSLIDRGARLFSDGRLAEAGNIWSTIANAGTRSLYVEYLRSYSDFAQSVANAESALSLQGPEAAMAAVKLCPPLPPPPPAIAADADPLGARERLARVGEDASRALVSQAAEAERAADEALEKARSGIGGDPRASLASRASLAGRASAEKAVGGFEEAGRLYRSAADFVPQAQKDAQVADAKALVAKELRDKLIKASLLSFPDRMGEIFARSPPAPERLSDKDLLAFNDKTASIISAGLSEFDRTVAEHPGLLDAATLERLRGSAKELSARFARMESAIKAIKDRGKPIMPLIIGIFNPQPGDPQRSRPASFSGRLSGGSDWWWGIADIPKGLAQDLVVTMSDSRPVRIYAAGRGLGGSSRPASDLVNPIFKVGNSWPVLNAGARLDQGVFHIEVGPGKFDGYSGEAVVYKSFMTRTR